VRSFRPFRLASKVTVERPASGKSPESNWNFAGKLAGNVVTVKTADLVMELSVNGKNMTGWSLIRGNRFDLNLAHK
jgi:predicted lipoprotein